MFTHLIIPNMLDLLNGCSFFVGIAYLFLRKSCCFPVSGSFLASLAAFWSQKRYLQRFGPWISRLLRILSILEVEAVPCTVLSAAFRTWDISCVICLRGIWNISKLASAVCMVFCYMLKSEMSHLHGSCGMKTTSFSCTCPSSKIRDWMQGFGMRFLLAQYLQGLGESVCFYQ